MLGDLKKKCFQSLKKYFFSSNKEEFKNAIETITKMKITENESQYLFDMVNSKKDGVIEVQDDQKTQNRTIKNLFKF